MIFTISIIYYEIVSEYLSYIGTDIELNIFQDSKNCFYQRLNQFYNKIILPIFIRYYK